MTRFRRTIFYLGGFDPRGVRFYHQLLKEQLARFTALTGEIVTMSPRKRGSNVRADWTIRNDSADVTTEYRFLRWEDIVRDGWIRSPWRLALRSIRAYWNYARHLDFGTARRLGRGPLVTLFFPPLLSILLPTAVGLPVGLIALVWLPGWMALLLGAVAGVVLARPRLIAIRTPWLLRFFVFNSELGRGDDNPVLHARVEAFAADIEAALAEDQDEILLIAHSNGSILAMQVLARLIERRDTPLPANFTLVTLGHCIPLVACRRDATRFHQQLRRVAGSAFRWVDIGSPPDGAAYFGVNPLLLQTAESRTDVELLSPRFHKFFDARRSRQGFAGKYEIHFDYLRIGDRPSPIDFPHLVTSPRAIQQSVAEFRTLD